MSKASEYAKAVDVYRNMRPPTFPGNQAFVCEDGRLRVNAIYLPPKEAIELAHWILDTFGDGE